LLVAADVDGTIDADPQFFSWLLEAVRKAGGRVAILTGSDLTGDAAMSAKREQLADLGVTDFDQLVVFPEDGIEQAKADWCRTHGADVLIDNDRGNAQAAISECLVLVPWATRKGKKKDG
jgi:hypothetical protein